MPNAPKHPCRYPGCPKLVTNQSYCPLHTEVMEKRRNAAKDQNRPTTTDRGYNSRWRRYRKQFLIEHPFCSHCGKLKNKMVVDHIEDHLGDYDKFWDTKNHQTLCVSCHSVKTNKERKDRKYWYNKFI